MFFDCIFWKGKLYYVCDGKGETIVMKNKKMIKTLILALAVSTLTACGATETTEPEEIEVNVEEIQQEETIKGEEILGNIQLGWNLGNSLDCCVDGSMRNLDGSYLPSFYETAWGNSSTTKEMIDQVKAAGFQAVRIPVTWYYNTYEENGKLQVQENWLLRVKEVVDYAYENDMYVILNSHHDEEMIYANKDDYEQVAKNVKELWTIIGECFKDYDEHLIFGGMNELNDENNSWETKEEYVEINNKLNQVYVDAVRSTGGNNTSRLLICGTYLDAMNDTILGGFKLPQDSAEGLLAAEVHLYTNVYNQELEKEFQMIDDFSKQIQAPVIVGEFGINSEFEPAELREAYAANFIYYANKYNISCFWWDDGGQYQLLDRDNLQWADEQVLEGLKNPKVYEENTTLE